MLKIYDLRLDGALISSLRGNQALTNNPEISWAVGSVGEDTFQTAYEAEFIRDGICIWNTGKVETDKQKLTYAGETLKAGDRVEFKIKVWGNSGSVGSVCDAFDYILLDNWTAPWITCKGEREKYRPVRFSSEVQIPEDIESCCLYVCGIGYQKVRIDGFEIDDAVLDPAFTDYDMRCCYMAYPNPADLTPGKHTLTVDVANGWRYEASGMLKNLNDGKGANFSGPIQLTILLRIRLKDGSEYDITTDDEWKWSYFGITYAGIFNGEHYDARFEEEWNSVEITAPPSENTTMMPMVFPPILDQETYSPVDVWQPEKGRYIVDFGQNIAGVTQIRLPKAAPGTKITIRHAEVLDENGNLYTAPLRGAEQTDSYTYSGDDDVFYEPEFTYHGFRYAEVTGYPDILTDMDIISVSRYSNIGLRGDFRCGSPMLNAINDICVKTELANIHSILTDCPQRDERMGWMNDATVRFEETPYNFETGRVWPKITADIVDTQRRFGDGAFQCTAPAVWGGHPADPVCTSFLMAGYMDWLHNGRTASIEIGYEGYKAWEDVLLSKSDNYIVNYSYYGDWASPAFACVGYPEQDGANSAITPGIFMSTGYSYLNCKLIAKFAGILGNTDDVEKYEGLAEKIKTAFLDKWYCGNGIFADKSTLEDGESPQPMSQACQCFPVWLGIIEGKDAQDAADALVKKIEADGNRFTTGNLCTRYLFDVLTARGHSDKALELLMSESYPSYGFMLQNEATTVWERFELKKNPGMNSHCHPMYGAVGYWFYSHLAGIQPLEDGYRRVRIAPANECGLLSCQASVNSPYGKISVRWTKKYGEYQLYCQIPFGVKADIDFGGVQKTVEAGYHVYNYKA